MTSPSSAGSSPLKTTSPTASPRPHPIIQRKPHSPFRRAGRHPSSASAMRRTAPEPSRSEGFGIGDAAGGGAPPAPPGEAQRGGGAGWQRGGKFRP